jgi:hypothetical protein
MTFYYNDISVTITITRIQTVDSLVAFGQDGNDTIYGNTNNDNQ